MKFQGRAIKSETEKINICKVNQTRNKVTVVSEEQSSETIECLKVIMSHSLVHPRFCPMSAGPRESHQDDLQSVS